MGRGIEKGEWGKHGGIIGLAKFAEEHRGAIEYDLLRKTGHELNDLGGSLSWGAFRSFVGNLEADSATARELEPDLSSWASVAKTNAILADMYDMLAAINANLKALGSGKRAQSPDKYPRPKKKAQKKIFNAAMSTAELRSWLNERRRRRSGRDD